jgi:hypothetical protein
MQVKRTAPSVDVASEPFDIHLQAENKSASRACAGAAQFENKRINGNSTKKTAPA